jgi:hypothetical protein
VRPQLLDAGIGMFEPLVLQQHGLHQASVEPSQKTAEALVGAALRPCAQATAITESYAAGIGLRAWPKRR